MLCQLNISHRFKSSNFDERKQKISFLIYHYTETKNLNQAIKILTNKKRKVSCHFIIDVNGFIYNLVDTKERAWHAGESMWGKLTDINSRSIGIEIVYPGEASGVTYSNKQISSLIELSSFLKKKFKICDKNILGHSDIAPHRKIDPGIFFPWEELGDNSLGLWANDKFDNSRLSKTEYNTFLKNLKKIGYPYIKLDQTFSSNKFIIDSFHRHHLPKMVKLEPNKSSLNKSKDLLILKNR